MSDAHRRRGVPHDALGGGRECRHAYALELSRAIARSYLSSSSLHAAVKEYEEGMLLRVKNIMDNAIQTMHMILAQDSTRKFVAWLRSIV